MTRKLVFKIGQWPFDQDIKDVIDFTPRIVSIKDDSVQGDYPFSAGQRVHILDQVKNYSFSKLYTGPYLEQEQEQMEIMQRIGDSHKFDLYHYAQDGTTKILDRQGVIFVIDVNETKAGEETRQVTYALREAYRMIINPCEFIVDSSRGGFIDGFVCEAGTTYPSPVTIDPNDFKQGEACVQLCGVPCMLGTIFEDSYLELIPFTFFDATWAKWFGFWFKTDNLRTVTNYWVTVGRDASNYVSYDFTDLIEDENTWYFIRIPRAYFTETGDFDWTSCREIYFYVASNAEERFCMKLDEVCLIE